METIQPNARVVLEYTLKDEDGDIIDGSGIEDGEPIIYVHGYGMLVPGLEAALEGLKVGTEKTVVVEAAEGFGERDEDLVLEVDRGDFPDPAKVAVDDEFIAESPDGEALEMRVVEVNEDTVTVDANHPLAGVTLTYEVKVMEVRAATEEEIEEAAEEFEEAGYGGCNDPTHDHSHGHSHGHEHGHSHGPEGENELVQLKGKKLH